ncbi:MAG TPA: subclass B3 metallo-beta-lactamase, partial [Thermoanaerobaculia bacterium]|nr:subclass B3 metallo-beta-lactamase [Thermoanaerobaculia bacterium]
AQAADGPTGQFRAPANWTEPIEPFAIAEGLYWVGSADLAAYLLTSDDGHILIDAPLEENVELVLGNIRKLGFEPTDARVLLASHGHFDHTGGMATMLERTGAELVLSPVEAILVGAGGKGDFHLGDRASYRPAKAARTIGHGETVRVGDRTLVAHLTPGHTKGCTSWSGTAKIAGEELTFVSICSLSVLPGYRLAGDDPSYPGIARDYCSSVAHLRSLEADLFLASHGSFIGLAEKAVALAAGDARAFVDPEGYAAYLDRSLQRIEETLAGQGFEGGCARVLAGN